MAVAIPYLVVAAAGVAAYSAIQQGQAAKAAGNYNATIQTQNAALARQQAQQLAAQSDRETYLRLGTIRANAAKNGGASDAGSVLDVLGDAAAQGEMQRQSILRAGEMKARDSSNTASLDSFQAKFAGEAGYTTAAGSLLSGGAGYYSNSLLRKG